MGSKNGLFENYKDLRVLVTGHTGFKGAWLSAWLERLGAVVAGLALAPEEDRPNLYRLNDALADMRSTIGDIRDPAVVRNCVAEFQPHLVFHLAAQALVRRSYRDPVGTFGTNVMGTVHVLDAARQSGSVKAVVCVTTDKVYENREWVWGYRESDALGGRDPYSASKACAEFVASVYQRTLMPMSGRVAVATARGGNVVGGGDWSEDRLVPDLVRALLAEEDIVLRNPRAVRPWQHVLDLCHGYLALADRLLLSPADAVGAWNFGPDRGNEVEVGVLAKDFCRAWGSSPNRVRVEPASLKESHVLKLDSTRANVHLSWRPVLGYEQALGWTADWYRRFHVGGESARELVDRQVTEYCRLLER
jgi:CDP-glucose 4,6-dehydratase